MMKQILYLAFCLFFLSCTYAQQKEKIQFCINNSREIEQVIIQNDYPDIELNFDSILCGLNFKPGNNYYCTKSEIEKSRSCLGKMYLEIIDTNYYALFLDSSMNVFTDYLLNKIIPYWYGTVWDFNGYTSRPNIGTIACGYFVSTTLRDMGLNLNRYKFAQKGPANEAKSIAIDSVEVLHYKGNNIREKLKEFKDGLYFVGLDNHVGYLYLNDNKSYFIHSNYIDGEVMIETTASSEAFYSTNYYIVKITGNRNLAGKWLT